MMLCVSLLDAASFRAITAPVGGVAQLAHHLGELAVRARGIDDGGKASKHQVSCSLLHDLHPGGSLFGVDFKFAIWGRLTSGWHLFRLLTGG